MFKRIFDRMIAFSFYSADGAGAGGGSAEGDKGQGEDASGEKRKAEGESGRTYSAEEFREVVKQRDEAKKVLREKRESEEKAERARLESQGEFEKVAAKLKDDLAKTSESASKAEEYKQSLEKILRTEADGLGDLAEAIISNTSLSFDARHDAIKTLKAKILGNGGSGTSAGSEGASRGPRKELTAEDIAKLSPIEKAKYYRENSK